MEEIKGTAGIEREILEDAKRRVDKLLANAETEAEKIRSSADVETTRKIKALENEFDKKLATYKQESLDRLPLERLRLRTKFVDASLKASFEVWLKGLDQEVFSDFCERRLSAASSFLPAGPLVVKHKGLLESSIAKISDILGQNRALRVESTESISDKGVIVEAADLSTRVRITSEELAYAVLERYRDELASALFPKGIAESIEGDEQ